MTKSEIQDKQICLPIIIFEVASMNSFGPATRDPRPATISQTLASVVSVMLF